MPWFFSRDAEGDDDLRAALLFIAVEVAVISLQTRLGTVQQVLVAGARLLVLEKRQQVLVDVDHTMPREL